jgi:hypothetical protein
VLTNGRGFGILTNVVARERVRESETNEPESLKELERAPEGERKSGGGRSLKTIQRREKRKKSDSERANNRLFFGENDWKGLNIRV